MTEARKAIESLKAQIPKEGYALTITPTDVLKRILIVMEDQEQRLSNLETIVLNMTNSEE